MRSLLFITLTALLFAATGNGKRFRQKKQHANFFKQMFTSVPKTKTLGETCEITEGMFTDSDNCKEGVCSRRRGDGEILRCRSKKGGSCIDPKRTGETETVVCGKVSHGGVKVLYGNNDLCTTGYGCTGGKLTAEVCLTDEMKLAPSAEQLVCADQDW
uniref:Secreted protein n=1 Tax=Chromera velia CCMP2878 TaxID=1169474 RepID=A0A0G4HZ25_9ALVE|eukprot:Cvel_1566.t1-p1 / transcript=Cvel_1566.t1 / gene=Cvel_1566 / organism=Chromera_velia_CCMP2878 / gene_product=hypothetical protein / transcript_product=hypothetical protein / location=Cvel_scaffold55:156844-157314(+) / protein_length=157 / sequence_SO=supercontig / SO=protein_coding / is_pseudo=false